MTQFGIDTGTRNNRLVSLDGTRLTVHGHLAALDGGLPQYVTTWTPAQWTELSERLCDEIMQNHYFPLGIDAALTLANNGTCRHWEQIARGFATPTSFTPWPAGGSQQQQSWWIMARLWTEVVFRLVTFHNCFLWQGTPARPDVRLIVEVYPRVSWLSLAAFNGIHITGNWKRVQVRDDIIAGLGFAWTGRRRRNGHDRDAAICAITVERVLAGHAGFLGEPIVPHNPTHFSGGGIALPR